MAITRITPYLNLNGHAEKAIAFYEHVLGAKVEAKRRFSDMPNTPPEVANRILHAELEIGDQTLFLSDGMGDATTTFSDNVQVAINFDSDADLQQKYDALARDGKKTQPVVDAFWGGKFGMLADAYGIQWMLTSRVV